MSSRIRLEHLKKVYGDKVIIPDLSAVIKEGEFFTLLGSSGCGKTTLLRMIAGFNSIEAGQVYFNDTVMNDVPAYKRNIGMVFQNYAVFPNLTVRKNVEYGLKNRKIPKEKREELSNEIMETVKITEHADKKPDQLSGGQQQRVALARAIVIQPDVLLMDEPLSNLDAKLRVEMRTVIKDIQKQIGITTVYVTHDQEEALAVSDRIAVMDIGVIKQIGYPRDLYLRPYNTFVATFIGQSNLFHGKVEKDENGYLVTMDADYSFHMNNLDPSTTNQNVQVAVRPEEFIISDTEEGIPATVKTAMFLGKYMSYEMELSDHQVINVSTDSGFITHYYEPGETVHLALQPNKVNVFTEDGEKTLIEGVVQYVE